MRTVTIINQKGGVGKTTICRNLGYIFAVKYNKRVLLIDLDSSGNLSDFFGIKKTNDLIGAAKVLDDIDLDPRDSITPTRVEGLDILAGNSTLGIVESNIKADNLTPQQIRLRIQLDKIKDDYDYCLIDCPPTVINAIMVTNALTSSDDVIIPCPADKDAVDGVSTIVKMVDSVRKFYNGKIAIRGIVFCRITRKTIDQELLKQKLSVPRFCAYIREASALAVYSRVECKAFSEYAPKAKGTHDMENVAAEYLGEPYPYPEDILSED